MTEECKHIWDNPKGIFHQGKPWIGLKGKYIRTCLYCGRKESFSRGMFNGWFSYEVKEEQK
jgi:hypothetical protein